METTRQSSDALTDALRCVVEVRRFLEHSLPIFAHGKKRCVSFLAASRQSGNSTGQDSASPPDAACRDEAVCPGRGKASCYLCLSSAAAAKPAAPVVRRRQLCTCSGLRLLPRRLQRQPNGVDCDERKREGKGGTEYEREGSEDEVDEGATTQEREGVDRDEGERDKETGKDRKQRGETAWCTCDCESEISAVDSCLSQRGDTKEARKGNREDGPAASQELCTCSQRRETEKTQPRDEERRGPREIVQSEAETAQRTEEAVVLSSAASRDNAESSYLFVGHRSSWRTRATGEKVGEVRESVLALARSRPLRGEREKERKPATRTPAGRSAASDAPPSRKRSAQEVKKITESAEERQRKETEDELLVPQLGVSPGDRRFQERGIDVHAGELSRERSSSTLEPLSARSASSFSFSSSFFSLSSPDILAHDDPLASASASLARSSGSSKPKGPQQQSPSASSSSSSASSSSSSASSPSSSSSSASSSSISRRTLLEAKASRLADFSFLFSGVGDDRLPTFRATRRHSASLKSPSSPSLSPSQSSATSVRVRPPRVALALQRRFLEGQKRAAFSELFGQIEAAEETGCPPSREDGNKRNEGAQREKGAATGQTAAEPTSEGSRRRREGQRNRREREDDHGQDEMRPNGETERELVREGLQPQSESFPRKSASGDALLAGLTDIVQRLKRPGARCGETSSIVFAAETESDRARNDRGKINLRDTEMARRPVEAKSDAQEKDDAGWTLQKTSGCLVGADSAPPPPRETFSTSPFFSSPPSSLSGDDKTGILLTPAFPVPASPPQLPAAHLPRTLTFGETESEVSGASLSSFSDPNGCLKPARHGAEKRKTEVALLRKGLPTRKEEREKALPWSLPRHGEGLSRHPPVVLSSACEQRERLLCPDSACAPRVGETARQPCLQTQPRREGGLPPTEHFIKGEGDGGVWPNAEPAGDSRERFLPRLRFQMDDEMEGSAGDVEAEHEQGADRRVVVGKHEGKNRLRDARESEAFAAPGDGQRDGYAMRAIRTVGEQEKGETEACLQREALPRKCSRDETEGENEHRDSQGRAGRGETPVSGFSSLAPSREVTHVIACAATRPSSRALPSLPETPDVRLITNAISAFSGKRRDSQKEKA
ncbi:hypothetical protein NCLIV_001560 [Neospora caninum Liverpool]|uniref:Uncharacterized protein n=1 Tax=Neospora caninum (strain Liverpool) TaxID=572307 RepID=F0V7H7_NEOCL|nr:hypothetical protein NCLIV_001560 [Neospora caninum Liverpool]CBZ49668.1 hypothetical protein NCLIV_001560 [Neospora caninum Liverpool]|eukprot:XP_003879703.1 hypothetical protein NCLIV_001560 [Neospora caninum Liverpool]